MNSYLLFFIGLAVITVSAEIMLRGASKVASLLGIKPIVIGLTVVSIGTSLPELAVGYTAVTEGMGDIAIGNIAGTNFVNILFILGLSAAIRPLHLQLNSIKVEIFVMSFAALLLLMLCLDGNLSPLDGLIMLLFGILYVVMIVRNSKKESEAIKKEYDEEYALNNNEDRNDLRKWIVNGVLLIVGMAGTVWGADYLVEGAATIAKDFGLSDAVIGLTIVAIGTSAPELITTLVSTIKNDRDVAIGNLLGSSITNLLIILGATSLFADKGINVQKDLLWIDLPLLVLVAFVCYPVFRSDQMVSRKEGISFMLLYLIYLGVIVFYRT